MQLYEAEKATGSIDLSLFKAQYIFRKVGAAISRQAAGSHDSNNSGRIRNTLLKKCVRSNTFRKEVIKRTNLYNRKVQFTRDYTG